MLLKMLLVEIGKEKVVYVFLLNYLFLINIEVNFCVIFFL